MKKCYSTLLLLISSIVISQSCTSGQYIKNPEKELKAEKIYIKNSGETIDYNIKITNISKSSVYLTIKKFTPITPEGSFCQNLGKDDYMVTYSGHGISANFDHGAKLGSLCMKLEKGESYIFSGSIKPDQCHYQANNKEKKKNLAEKIFTIQIEYVQNFNCQNPKDCEKFKNNKEFELWDDEARKLIINDIGFVVSQFIFKFDDSGSK